jgi:phage protein D
MPNRIIPAKGPIDNPTVTIRVDGNDLGPTTGIISVVVNREFNKVPFARIKIRDGFADERGFTLSSGELFIPGNEIEVLAGHASNEEQIFKGKITTHRLKADYNGSILEAIAKDAVVAIKLVEKDRFFREETDAGAWETIIGEYAGLDAELSGGEIEYEELVQYRQTDWDFLISRAEANGKLLWVDDGTVHITAPAESEDALLELN